jgi:hypothetical protein
MLLSVSMLRTSLDGYRSAVATKTSHPRGHHLGAVRRDQAQRFTTAGRLRDDFDVVATPQQRTDAGPEEPVSAVHPFL